MTTPPNSVDQSGFRRTLIRVMTMQLITLVLLGILQMRYDL